MLVFFIFAAFIGIAVVIGLLSRRYERQHVEALQAFAAENGMDFSAVIPQRADGMRSFPLMERGRNRQRANYLTATADDRTICLFEYSYTSGSGKNKHRHRQTVCWFLSPLLSLPTFSLRPRHFFDRVGDWFGRSRLTVTEDLEFNRLYVVEGDNEAELRTLFDTEVVMRCVKHQARYHVEGWAEQMIIYRPSRRIAAREIGGFLQDAYELFAALQRAEANSVQDA